MHDVEYSKQNGSFMEEFIVYIIRMILLTLFVCCLCVYVPANDLPQAIDVKGTVMVPIRDISIMLGAKTTLDKATGVISLITTTTKVEFNKNSKTAIVNGKSVPLPSPVIEVEGAIFIPLRLISNIFNAKIELINKTGTVILRIPATDEHQERVIDMKITRNYKPKGINNQQIGQSSKRPITKIKSSGLPIPSRSEINNLISNSGGYIHFAATMSPRSSVQRLSELYDAGADVNLRNRFEQTPLHLAVFAHNYAGTKWLLEHNALVDATDKNNETPINCACFNGLLDIVELLVAHGANVDGAGKGGNTPLTSAVSSNKVEVVKYLLSKGANVNATCYNDATPLHIAVSAKKIESIKVLLEAGADVRLKNVNGYTPMDLAIKSRKQEIIDLLQKY